MMMKNMVDKMLAFLLSFLNYTFIQIRCKIKIDITKEDAL